MVIHLIVTKCLPVLLYGLETCPLKKTDLNALDFVVNRFVMKLFQSSNIDIVINVASRTFALIYLV